VTCLCNVATAIAFAPLLLLGGQIPSVADLWQPALVGMIFVFGQILALLALRLGDVSIATPVLGLKIVLVAGLATLIIGERLSLALWSAAALSSVAIILLNSTRAGAHARVGTTIAMSGSAAMAYAMFDVLVQKWSPVWGAGRFLPIMMGFSGLASLALWPLGASAPKLPASTKSRLWAGVGCLALQSVTFVTTITWFGRATSANVLYSSRGLWSVLAVWLAGHWFQSREQKLGGKVLARRLCGAALLLAAITLVLLG
jgi:drug/metabolite transporter (DMT)-like permease